MGNITVTRYPNPAEVGGWQGYFEPEDQTWIAFVDSEGKPVVFLDRDPVTGACGGLPAENATGTTVVQ
jgi:hypothetical protein